MLADPGVDAVYISTPPSEHEKWSRAALEHGKHVLCEKPAVLSLDSARRLVTLSRSSKRCLLEGYMFRFHPQHDEFFRRVRDGAIGDVSYFHSEYTYPRPPAGDIRLKPELKCGVFFDSLGYPASALLLVAGRKPEAVFATQLMDEATSAEQAVALQVMFKEGLTGHLYSGFGISYRSCYVLAGSTGRLSAERAFAVNPDQQTELLLETGQRSERIVIPPADQFRLMIEAFARAANDPEAAEGFAGRLIEQAAVMDAASRSLQSGRPERVEQT